jgi:hypothetical protein
MNGRRARRLRAIGVGSLTGVGRVTLARFGGLAPLAVAACDVHRALAS